MNIFDVLVMIFANVYVFPEENNSKRGYSYLSLTNKYFVIEPFRFLENRIVVM